MTATRRPVERLAPVMRSGVAPGVSVLAIQSDAETRNVLERGLGCLGLSVAIEWDAVSGVLAARHDHHKLVLLDLVLPGHDGFDVLAEIREQQPRLPVIMLTALGGVENRVRALDAGAVDFVVTPFSLEELAARIRAQLRQSDASRTTRLSGAAIDVDLVTRTAVHRGVPVHLTTMEFRLLVHLMQRSGIIQSRGEILREVWGHDSQTGKNLVDVYVGYLRRKLGESGPGQASPIQTVRSRGYRFVETDPERANTAPRLRSGERPIPRTTDSRDPQRHINGRRGLLGGRSLPGMNQVSHKRIGMNEALFREANEGIERGLWPGEHDQRVPFRCECAGLDCAETVRLTPAEYEAVRADPRRFAVVAGHEVLGAEIVAERHPDYLVVEKVGDAGSIAEELDPRA